MTLAYGAADGYGRYGVLDHDEDGLPICHECGTSWRQLATHARYAHGLTAREYRARHGLGDRTRLVSRDVSEALSEVWKWHEAEHRRRLDATRDPERAARSPRSGAIPGRPWAPEVRAKRQAAGRALRSADLTAEQAATLGDGIDLQAWADAARALLAQGATLAALGRAADISPATAAQRLRRYPPRT